MRFGHVVRSLGAGVVVLALSAGGCKREAPRVEQVPSAVPVVPVGPPLPKLRADEKSLAKLESTLSGGG